jgi:hypothetical protein
MGFDPDEIEAMLGPAEPDLDKDDDDLLQGQAPDGAAEDDRALASELTSILPEVLDHVGARARADALARTQEQRVAILARCARHWDEEVVFTGWLGGKFNTTGGERLTFPWAEFCALLIGNAELVVPKGDGFWFSPATSTNGGCCDEDGESLTQLALDSDMAGEWFTYRAAIQQTGLAHVVQRSSSHTGQAPKWHSYVPLVTPIPRLSTVPDLAKSYWRMIYRHCVAWCSVLADLECDPQSRFPKFRYGFDPSPDRLVQPWFPGTRPTEESTAPETIGVEGLALDLSVFLKSTGFEDDDAIAKVRAKAKRSRNSAPVLPLGAPSTLTSADNQTVVARATAYLEKLPPSIAGNGGDAALFRAAVRMVRGFSLDPDVALELLRQFNTRCDPPWDEGRLTYKVRQAYFKSTMPFGFLLKENRLAAAVRRVLEKRGAA